MIGRSRGSSPATRRAVKTWLNILRIRPWRGWLLNIIEFMKIACVGCSSQVGTDAVRVSSITRNTGSRSSFAVAS